MSLVSEALGSIGSLEKQSVEKLLGKLHQTFGDLQAEFCLYVDERYNQYLLSSLEQTEVLSHKINKIDQDAEEIAKKINTQLQLESKTTPEKIDKCRQHLQCVRQNLDAIRDVTHLSDCLDELDQDFTNSSHGKELARRAAVCRHAEQKIQQLIDENAKIRLLTALDKNIIALPSSTQLVIGYDTFVSLKNEFLLHKERLIYSCDNIWSDIFRYEKQGDMKILAHRDVLTLRVKCDWDKALLEEAGAALLLVDENRLAVKIKELAVFFTHNILRLDDENGSRKVTFDETDGKCLKLISSTFPNGEKRQPEELLIDLRLIFEKIAPYVDVDFQTKLEQVEKTLNTQYPPNPNSHNTGASMFSSESKKINQQSNTTKHSSNTSGTCTTKNLKTMFGQYVAVALFDGVVKNLLKPKLVECCTAERSSFDEQKKTTIERQDSDQETSSFKYLLDSCQKLRSTLVDLKFLTPTTTTADGKQDALDAFVADVDKLFFDAKCQTVLAQARQLIMQTDLHNYLSVGHGEITDVDDEKAELQNLESLLGELSSLSSDSREKITDEAPPAEFKFDDQKRIPAVYRLPRCKISSSIRQLHKLIIDTLNQASKSSDPVETMKFYQLSRNCFDLFVTIYYPSHRQQILDFPLSSALVYNNCQYMAHQVMTLTLDYSSILARSLKISGELGLAGCSVTFLDFVPALKSLANQFFVESLSHRKQVLLEFLTNIGFSSLNDQSIMTGCRKTLKQCLLQLQSLHNVWSDVWPTVVVYKALSFLVKSVLDLLTSKVTSMEDITADDAYSIKEIFDEFFNHLEVMFTHDKTPEMQRFCEREFYRFKELLFILSSNLQDIDDRWSSGQGPLALWMTSEEVKNLVRAVFQNTDKRAQLLAKIKGGAKI